MKKKLLIEQTQAYYGQSKVDEIIDPIIRDAIDSGCLNEYMKSITSYDVKHPITGKNTVQVSTSEDVFVQSDNRSYPLFAYITSTPYGQEGQYKIDYFYKKGGINYYEKTKGWKCQTSGIKKKISDALEKTGFFKSQESMTDGGGNYELVPVASDSKLPENKQLYDTVDSWNQYVRILDNIKTPLMMWKSVKWKSQQTNITEEGKEILKSFNGYSPCSKSQVQTGEFATINLHNLYPTIFETDYTICKNWNNINTDKKSDCVGVIDGYYDEIIKYNIAPQKKPSVRYVEEKKDMVIKCISEWGKKMPFRRKKINFLQELNPSHPFNIRESENELTNVIRESLRIIKKRKNR
jgi:hypothetical protein